MAASIPIDKVDDFVEAVHKKYLKEGRWTDVSMPLQKYYFASRLFDKKKKNEVGGPTCEFKLRVRNPGNFKFTGLYASDSTNRVNVLTHGNMGWSMNTTNYTYDIAENVFAKGAKEIIEYIDVQEQGLYNDYFGGMEDAMFGAGPTSPTQDEPPPASLLWWLQTSATEGFNGGEPSGFEATGTGGVLSSTYTGWKNRTFSYDAWNRDDAIDKVIRGMDRCNFKPPVPYKQAAPGEPDWELLTTYSRLSESFKLLQLGNDNIKNDLAAFANTVLIRGVPMNSVPAWTNTTSPVARTDGVIAGVNWTTFEYLFREGWSMKKRPAYQDKDKHNVRWRVMDDQGQVVCYDRRGNFIGYSTVAITEVD